MRILMLGAGAIGGYFGARIHAAGGDVTFLARPERAARLSERGLRVTSVAGNLEIRPKLLTRDELTGTFDLVVLSCKAFDLDSAMDVVAPVVGERSLVAPLLNGVRHIDTLTARFGRERVLGGVALISAAVDPDGDIRHMNRMNGMTVGALDGQPLPALEALAKTLASPGFDLMVSDDIMQAMWDKFVFLATLAGATCLMRANVGTLMATRDGEQYVCALIDECMAIAEASGHPLTGAKRSIYRNQLTDRDSTLTASMLRDVEADKPTEAEHILGDLIHWADLGNVKAPRLSLAYSHLQAYERRRRHP
ncbi:MAG: 2-dehydropantoate 2-reductase [Candidatus Accumulibacter sp.]|nr:2-dehydropantoate 2-reductase [Accumulibacter sp.]